MKKYHITHSGGAGIRTRDFHAGSGRSTTDLCLPGQEWCIRLIWISYLAVTIFLSNSVVIFYWTKRMKLQLRHKCHMHFHVLNFFSFVHTCTASWLLAGKQPTPNSLRWLQQPPLILSLCSKEPPWITLNNFCFYCSWLQYNPPETRQPVHLWLHMQETLKKHL